MTIGAKQMDRRLQGNCRPIAPTKSFYGIAPT